MKKTLIMIGVLMSGFMILGCGSTADIDEVINPIVTIEVEGYGVIELELYPDVAPNTVRNFVHLIENGYYDGVGFHRIIEGFMIQGGQGSALSCRIEGEFTSNGYTNDLNHTRGVISMARTVVPNSATGQFFIVHQTSPHLDGHYAAFGMLIEGWDVLDAIAAVETGAGDAPTQPVIMTRVRVDTHGIDYQSPVCYGN